jgi:hypothetical protein
MKTKTLAVCLLLLVGVVDAAARKKPTVEPLTPPLKIGMIGTLGNDPVARVLQVVDSSHAILSIEKPAPAVAVPGGTQRTYGGNTAETVWATVPTEGMVTDQCYVFTKNGAELWKSPAENTAETRQPYGTLQMFKVTGTKTYKTAAGSKTVVVIEPFGKPPGEPHGAAKPTPKSRPAAELRTWTSGDGNFTVEARLVKATADTVWLEKKDGTTVHVPKEKLSDDDLSYIKHR